MTNQLTAAERATIRNECSFAPLCYSHGAITMVRLLDEIDRLERENAELRRQATQTIEPLYWRYRWILK